jgi:predicted N-acetyltransferase YhbS
MPGITISFMEIGDLNEAAKVLSIAMLDNPMHVAVYQGADENSRLGIEKDFSQLLRQRPGIVFVAKEKQEIVGVMRMNSCTGKDVTDDDAISQDESSLEYRKKIWMNEWAQRDPKEPHWHLGPIGVLTGHQGRGVGSRLMQRYCKEVDACKACAYLETDKDVNVAFYKKFGFETTSECMIWGVKNYFMWREARE